MDTSTTDRTPNRTALIETYRSAGGPLVTVYLKSPSAVEDAEDRFKIRKKNLISELEQLDTDASLIESVESEISGIDHDDGAARVLLVGNDGVILSEALVRPLVRSMVRVGPCPALLPLISATQTDVEHLAVLVDRTGADVMVRNGVGGPLDEMEVDGPDVRIHRGHPGGWSQKRFQQTAENAWENNAREVVDQINEEFPDVDLMVCGGDVRAVGFFKDHLPARFEVHEVDGSRHSDPDAFLDEVDIVLRTRAAGEVVDLLERWRSATANDLGTTGLQVLDDITHGRVEHLLVVDDTRSDDRPSSYFDFAQNVHTPDQDDNTEAPITDAAIVLATATGAEITVVPAHADIEHGVAAILRF